MFSLNNKFSVILQAISPTAYVVFLHLYVIGQSFKIRDFNVRIRKYGIQTHTTRVYVYVCVRERERERERERVWHLERCNKTSEKFHLH